MYHLKNHVPTGLKSQLIIALVPTSCFLPTGYHRVHHIGPIARVYDKAAKKQIDIIDRLQVSPGKPSKEKTAKHRLCGRNGGGHQHRSFDCCVFGEYDR